MISWSCITYGRENGVPEIIRYFLAQNYKDEKEFVILNDDPDVHYVFDHPEVKIYNWDHRFKNVRTKFNKSMELCSGDLVVPVGDDDWYTPTATKKMVKGIGNNKFLAVNGFWKVNKNGSICWIQQAIAGLFICRKDFFFEIGGYTEWSDKPVRSQVTRQMTDVAHIDLFDRVKEAGHYKELKLDQQSAFFTWDKRGSQDNWGDTDKEKHIIKERIPRIVTILRGKE